MEVEEEGEEEVVVGGSSTVNSKIKVLNNLITLFCKQRSVGSEVQLPTQRPRV